MAVSQATRIVPKVQKLGMFARWMRGKIDEPKLGLLNDDYEYAFWEDEDHPIAVEAIRRLPHHLNAARMFRLKRAMHYSGRKELLPQSEWISYEYDLEHGFYLKPYIDEVEAEFEERKLWDSKR